MLFSASRILEKGKGRGAKEQPGNKYDAKQDLWFAVLSFTAGEAVKVVMQKW